MTNVAIYYRTSEKQSPRDVIEEIEQVINSIKKSITGVYVDAYNHNDEFLDLINKDFSKIDILYINRLLKDEFDNKLINELGRTFKFRIVYFCEI